MLYTFDSNEGNFGKKGDALRKIYKFLNNEKDVYVPETLVLSLDFFDKYVKENLLNEKKSLLTDQVENEIINEINARFKGKRLVVRSSASCEDSIMFTNSGQYDSFLNLSTDEEILSAINKTFYSFISPNAMEYYKINDIDLTKQGMAVLIQEVAPVVCAGVMFTANPITGNKKPLIEFCEGLGENVVSGQKKVITIKDNYDSLPISFTKLLEIGKRIELLMGVPQDIEWGMDTGNNIYIFQARPIVINKRKTDKLQNIDISQDCIIGEVISNGFTIGQINKIDNFRNSEIIVQTGKLTSKDLTTIINSKAIILKTGGYLSHFANIIREFNKPSMIVDINQSFESSENYVVDGYNGCIYKLDSITSHNKNKAYWNYLVDLVLNGNRLYLDSIGIKKYTFKSRKRKGKTDLLTIGNNLYAVIDDKVLEIEFYSLDVLNIFIKQYVERVMNNGKVYRRK